LSAIMGLLMMPLNSIRFCQKGTQQQWILRLLSTAFKG
jgi:hypothetical protein